MEVRKMQEGKMENTQIPEVIFQTKRDILTARDINQVVISPTALSTIEKAKMTDILGLKITVNSPLTVIDAEIIDEDDPSVFFDLAFGKGGSKVETD